MSGGRLNMIFNVADRRLKSRRQCLGSPARPRPLHQQPHRSHAGHPLQYLQTINRWLRGRQRPLRDVPIDPKPLSNFPNSAITRHRRVEKPVKFRRQPLPGPTQRLLLLFSKSRHTHTVRRLNDPEYFSHGLHRQV